VKNAPEKTFLPKGKKSIEEALSGEKYSIEKNLPAKIFHSDKSNNNLGEDCSSEEFFASREKNRAKNFPAKNLPMKKYPVKHTPKKQTKNLPIKNFPS
jgi:hypothetical protein